MWKKASRRAVSWDEVSKDVAAVVGNTHGGAWRPRLHEEGAGDRDSGSTSTGVTLSAEAGN